MIRPGGGFASPGRQHEMGSLPLEKIKGHWTLPRMASASAPASRDRQSAAIRTLAAEISRAATGSDEYSSDGHRKPMRSIMDSGSRSHSLKLAQTSTP